MHLGGNCGAVMVSSCFVAKFGMFGAKTFVGDIPVGKLTWQWNIPMFNRKYIFKGSSFHCYVRLPECIFGSLVKPSFFFKDMLEIWRYS